MSGRHCPGGQHEEGSSSQRRALINQGCGFPESVLGKILGGWWAWQLVLCRRGSWRSLETVRRDQLVDEPGIKHEISGLVKAFNDMLRPCRSLEQLADKQGFFFIAAMYFHSNTK